MLGTSRLRQTQQADLVDPGQHEAPLVQRLGALGARADAHSGDRVPDAQSETRLLGQRAAVVDEVGRCVFDRACTDLFFDVIDRRYEKEGPNTMILTSNVAPSG